MSADVCRTCGAPLHLGDVFCGNCGASVGPVPAAGGEAVDASDAPGAGPVAKQPNPIEVAQMPTVPPPAGTDATAAPVTTAIAAVGDDDDGRGSGRRSGQKAGRGFRLFAGTCIVLLVAIVAGLTVVLLAKNDDLDNERAKAAQAQAALEIVTSTTIAGDDSGATDPTIDPTADLETQVAQLQAALEQARADLTAEKQGRADDAAAAQEAAQQAADAAAAAATQAASDLAAAQAAQAAAEQQLAGLEGVFPVTLASLASTNPSGTYTATLTAGECTLALCTLLPALALTIPDASTISGDRINGALTFDGLNYTNSGPLELAKSPQCDQVDQPSTYSVTFHPAAVDVVNGALVVTKMEGIYSETISSGLCAGQHRTYAVSMDRD